MRLLVVHEFPPPGTASGEARVATQETKSLLKAGHQVELLDLATLGGAPVLRPVRSSYNRVLRSQLREVVERFGPDLVHIHGITPYSSGSVFDALQESGTPHVQTLHNYRWLCIEGGLWRDGQVCTDCVTGSRLSGVVHRCVRNSLPISAVLAEQQRRGRRAVARSRGHFIAVSEYVKGVYESAGWESARIHVKYNTTSSDDVRVLDMWTPGKQVLYVGRVSRAKGLGVVADVADRMPGVTFHVCGEPPRGEGDVWRALKSKPNVILHGIVDQSGISRMAGRCAAQVVPSQVPETFGLAALEGMIRGLPIVATRIGGLPEVVGDAGVLVAPGESGIDHFVRSIDDFVRRPERRNEASERGIRRSELFSERTQLGRLESIYTEVLAAWKEGQYG